MSRLSTSALPVASLSSHSLFVDKKWLDKQKIASAFGRAAHSYEQHNELQRRSGNALLALLNEHLASRGAQNLPECGLDLGCGSGWFLPMLKPKTKQLLALDLSPAMLQQAQQKADVLAFCGDMDAPPVGEHSLDWVFANLCMQWSHSPAHWLANWSQCLKPGGVLVFATLLDGSLKELSDCWQQQGQPNPINAFISQARLEQHLVATGKRWQCQTNTEQLSYATLKELLLSLKGIGANQVTQEKRAGLMGKNTWQQLNLAYPVNNQGQCLATYQLAYGVIYG
ncbi:malonyl-ACP O-methyltransferase BioC [Oceanisphaera pacifica]|uniref:Malonyl-[acyl-carrier protein] O-methyltransferase n=1 Tax=Oceanisphaera pacifica TaxID=2818389 RepID=A0ABS3NEA0_9GAMM|nr:malonyl-ACP O-methyltransferase BioC [Oceanisphaera pacifica]MBO1518611.1 malonyl-ACP O-methyltransferase BioC [Oceanisphaera pacifica]